MNRTVLTEHKAGWASGALHGTLDAHFQAENERKAKQGCNFGETPFVRVYWHAYSVAAGFLKPLRYADRIGLFQAALDVYAQAEKQCALDYANHALTEETREEARIARVCLLSLYNAEMA